MTRRLIAGFLTLCMIVSLCPPSAFAVHSSASEMTEPETVVTEPAADTGAPEETAAPDPVPSEPQKEAEPTQPEETLPEGTLPEGTQPEGTLPGGTLPAQTQPAQTQPAGTLPEGEEYSYRSISVGQTVTLTTGLAEGGSWTSDNLAAATVTSAEGDTLNALVYGVAAGVTTVTYTADGAEERWVVYVNDPTVQNGETTGETVAAEAPADSEQATVEDQPQGGSVLDKLGDLLTGAADTQAAATSITAGKTTITVGESITLSGSKNAYGGCSYGSWSVDDASIASITTTDGKLTGKAAGTVTVTHTYCSQTGWHSAYYNGHKEETETLAITVELPDLTGVTVSGADTVIVGVPTQLTATAQPAGAEMNLTWASSDEGTLTVTQDGIITGVKAGTATVTVTDESTKLNASHTVTVREAVPVTDVTLTGADTMAAFTTTQLTADITPADADVTGKAWESSNDEILTVDNSTGLVTAVAPGEAVVTLTVTCADGTRKTVEHPITVTDATEATAQAEFYYLRSPDKDPNSNETGSWGSSSLGIGTVNMTNATWENNKNCFSVSGRVVSWPSSCAGGEIPKGSAHWTEIFNAYKSSVEAKLGGVTITADDVEYIKVHPYKISKNNGSSPDLHVDCTVEVKTKNVYTATYYLWDAGTTGYEWKASAYYKNGENTQPGDFTAISNLDGTKSKNGINYTFDGWYTDAARSGSPVGFPYAVGSNVTFYAKYVAGYTVTYNLNGGRWNGATTFPMNEGATVSITSKIPTRDGYKFIGWTSGDITEAEIEARTFTMPDHNVTLTAQWEKSDFTVKYRYTGIVPENAPAAPGDTTHTYDTTVTVDEKPTLTGYTFKGWTTEDAAITNGTFTMPAKDVTLYGSWEKKTVGYTVEYYYDGNLNSSKTETGNAEFGDVINNYTDKPETGYKFDHTENLPLTIGEDASANVIKVYYVKDNTQQHSVSYRVDYYRDGALVESGTPKTVTDWIGSDIFVTVDKSKINTADKFVGYKFVKTEPMDIPDRYDVAANGESENHVINVYYVKDNAQQHTVSYRVEYYKDGVLADTDAAVSETGWIGEATTVTVNTAAINTTDKYVGYKPDKTEPGTIPANYTVAANAGSGAENVIKVYYVKDGNQTHKVSYHVEYYKDGVLANTDAAVSATGWIGEATTVTVNTAAINTTDKYVGYKPDKTEPGTIPANYTVAANAGSGAENVIKVYYVKDDSQTQPTKYTVRYTINGIERDSFDVTGTAWINDNPAMIAIAADGIPAPEDKFQGYKLDPANPTYPAPGTLVESGSKFTVNYVARSDTAYKVEHYQQNLVGDGYAPADTDIMKGTTGEQTAAVARSYPGFTAQNFNQMTIAPDGSTVVKIYYNRNTYTVTYKDGVTDETVFEDRVIENVRYGTATPAFGEIPTRTGYVFADWDPAVAGTVTADATYTAKWTPATGTAYTVKHYQQNLADDGYTLTDTDYLTGTTGDSTAAVARSYTGFTAQSFEQKAIAANGSTVVDIYYTRNSYTVTYQYIGTRPADATALPAEATYKYDESVTVAAPATATGYTFSGWSESNFTMPDKDVTITGSFTVRSDLSYTVNYLEKGTDNVLHAQKVQNGMTFDDVVKASDEIITIDGYNYDSTDKETLTITTGDNVINLYYTKRIDLTATVNYYWNGTTEKVHESETVTNLTFQQTLNKSPISVAGCTPVSDASQTITIGTDGNVINFYYYKNVELTANSKTGTYNGAEQTVEGYTGAPAGADFSGITVSASGTNAGTYDAKFADGTVNTVDATGKYIVTKATDGKLTINPAAVTVTADNKTKVFGAAEPELTATVTGTLNGDKVVYTLSRESGEAVGSYTITPTGEKIQGNYEVTYETGTLTITASDSLTVSGTDYTGTYDANAHGDAATASVTEGTTVEYQVNGGEWTTEVPKITNVGTVTVKVRATNPNYETAEDTYTLTVTPAEVTVTADNKTKVYGDPDPALTATVAGVLDGAEIRYDLYRVPGEDVGSYAITLIGAVNQGNYHVTFVPGTLTVTKNGALTVTGKNYTGIYDGASHGEAATASVTEGTTISYSVDNGATWTTTVPTIKDAGTVKVTVKAENPNYQTAQNTYTLTVSPRAIELTAASDSKAYNGTPLTKNSYSITKGSFVDGEGLASVTVEGSQTDVGSSDNTITGHTLTPATLAKNYTITYVKGTLTVTASGTMTVNGKNYTGVYDGASHGTAATTNVTAGTTISYSTDGGEWTTEVPTIKDVGTKTVKVRATNPNYDAAETEYTLTVTAREVELTADSDSKAYNGTPLTNSGYSITKGSFVDGEGLASVTVEGSQTDVGSSDNTITGHTLTPATLAKNYTITYVKGTLTVTASSELTVEGTDYNNTYDGASHGEAATASVPDAKIEYSTDGGENWTTTVPTIKDVGTVTVKVRATNPNYAPAENSYTLTVNRRQVTLTSDTASKAYDGTPLTRPDVTVTGDGFVTDEVTDIQATGSVTHVADNEVTNTITYTEGENFKASNYTITVKEGKLSITPVAIELTADSASKPYDGTALTNNGYTITSGKFVGEEGLESVTVEGSQTLVGSSNNAITGYALKDNTEASDYTITTKPGTLTVTDRGEGEKYVITVNANSGSFTYDGTEHTVSGFENLTFTVNGKNYTVEGLSASASATDATVTAIPVPVTGTAVVKDAEGHDVTAQFTVTTKDGTLTINKRAVTLISETDSKEYDGTPLTRPNVTVTGEGFVNGEVTNIRATGSATYVSDGEVTNTIAYDPTATFKADNYTITKNEGKLSITKKTEAIVITTPTNSKVYDGNYLTDDNHTYSGKLAEGDTLIVTYSSDAKQKDVGSTPNAYVSVKIERDVDGVKKDVTTSYTIGEPNIGTLTVMPRAIELTAGSANKAYDGTPLTKDGYTISNGSFVDGEGLASVTVEGSQTVVGSSENVIKGHTLADGTLAKNYDITYVKGTLTVTASGKLTVAGNTATFVYDGKSHGEAAVANITDGTTIFYSTDGGESWTTDFPTIKDVGSKTVKVRATNPNYKTAEDIYNLTVNPAEVTVTADNKTKVYGDPDPALTATVAGLVDDAEIHYDLHRVPGVDVGSYPITLIGAENQGNYHVTFVPGTLTIKKNGGLTVSGTGYTGTYDANTHGTAATASVKEGTTVSYSTDGGKTWTDTYPTITNVGTVTVMVKAENDNYETATASYTLTVNPAEVTVTADNKTKVYGETDPALTAKVAGVVDGTEIHYDLSRESGENVGSYPIIPTGEKVQGNYEVTYKTGTLTITPITEKIVVTVTGHTGTAVYDGTAHTVTGYDVAVSNPLYTAADFAFDGTASVTGTDAGGYPMGLAESQFRNASANFTEVSFVVNDGGLTVDKRPVTLSSVTDSKVYDRTPLTRPDVTVGGMGFVSGEVTGIRATGSVLNVSEGTVPNPIEFTPTAAFKAGNYTIEYHVGTLSVTPAARATVVVTGKTATFVYDGQPHTVTGFTNDGRSRDITVTLLRAGADSVTGTEINRYNMGLTAADFIASSPNYRKVDVEVVDGYLDIVTVNVNVTITVRGNRDTVTYDGSEHSVTGYEIVSVTTNVGRNVTMNGLTLKLRGTASATGTEPGTYPMGLTAADFDVDTTIYRGVRVVVEDGELVIKPEAVPEAETEPTETIPDESVPMGQPDDIPDEDVPMAAPAWALLNLILSLLTVLGSLFLLSGLFGKKKEEATDENGNLILDDNGESVMNRIKQRTGWRITSLLPAIGSVIAFILTENMRNPMVLVDRWTLLMVIIAVIQVLVMMLSKKKVEETEEA